MHIFAGGCFYSWLCQYFCSIRQAFRLLPITAKPSFLGHYGSSTLIKLAYALQTGKQLPPPTHSFRLQKMNPRVRQSLPK
jgi:hypothetical protein